MKNVRVNIRGVVNLRLSDLNAFQEDIKVLTDENYLRLKEEILQDGFSFSPHVFLDSEGKAWLLDGHQRRTCLERMEKEGFQIPIIPCMEVEAEDLEHARRLVLAGTSQYGTFQVKKVVDFVKKTGLPPMAALGRFSFAGLKMDKVIPVSPHERMPITEETYSKKIQAPIYEPKGENPEIHELTDTTKMEELQREIAAAEGISEAVKEFLRLASYRHVVFDYEKIAEAYAHAPKEVQVLMEKSALVIIDFQKAIEGGFVVMTKELAEAYGEKK